MDQRINAKIMIELQKAKEAIWAIFEETDKKLNSEYIFKTKMNAFMDEVQFLAEEKKS